jgi:PAS domain S-box-containing protein
MHADHLFQLAYAPMSIPVLMIDEKGGIVCVNNKLIQRFGFALGELVGQPVEVLLPERFRKGHPRHIREYFMNPVNRSLELKNKFWGCTKSGEEFPVDISIHCIKADDGLYAVGNIIDLGRTWFAEQHLQQEKLKIDLAVKSSGIGVWVWEINSNRLTWDDRMFELYELPRKEVMTYDDWRNRLHPDDRQSAEESLAQAMNQKRTWQAEFRIVMDNGEVKHISASNEVVLDHVTQEVVRVIGANLDISDLRKGEELLKEKSYELEAFSQRVAHDLRGPISAAIALGELLDLRNPSESVEIISRIDNCLKNCSRIIEGLYKLSGVSGSRLKPEYTPLIKAFDLAMLATHDEREKYGANVAANLPHEALFDNEALPQVLQNLMTNAMRYYEGDGFPEISVSSEAVGDQIWVHVDDNGPGISMENFPCF